MSVSYSIRTKHEEKYLWYKQNKKFVEAKYNQITEIYCSKCHIFSFLNYHKIYRYYFDENSIKEILEIPRDLQILNAKSNKLSDFDELPETLNYLNISENNFKYLPDNLPDNLYELDCSNNKIFEITDLPQNIKKFKAGNNRIIYLDIDLPDSLVEISLNIIGQRRFICFQVIWKIRSWK